MTRWPVFRRRMVETMAGVKLGAFGRGIEVTPPRRG
jgi:hypothetical protein